MNTVTIDAETSGVDTANDRIITWFMRAREGDKVVFERNWIIDPGVEIPEEAAAVHGMSTQWVREHGRKDVARSIGEIQNALEEYAYKGFVLCGYNHAFDLAMLSAEVYRHRGFHLLIDVPNVRYVDPAIFSRVFDKYVKGGHQLITVAKRNGIEIEEDRLHAADYDVEVTEKLVRVMLNRAWRELPEVREGCTPDEFVTKLQGWQKEQKALWADHLTAYFQETGKTEEDGSRIVVSGAFPY